MLLVQNMQRHLLSYSKPGVTEALKTGNIKTVLSILRTIDKEKLEYRRCSHISPTSNTSATLRVVSVSAASDEPSQY
jgi:hypothetical protein